MRKLIRTHTALPASLGLVLLLGSTLVFFPAHCITMLLGMTDSSAPASTGVMSHDSSHAVAAPMTVAHDHGFDQHETHDQTAPGESDHPAPEDSTPMPCCPTLVTVEPCSDCGTPTLECCDTTLGSQSVVAVSSVDRSSTALVAVAFANWGTPSLEKPAWTSGASIAPLRSHHLSSRSVLGVFLI